MPPQAGDNLLLGDTKFIREVLTMRKQAIVVALMLLLLLPLIALPALAEGNSPLTGTCGENAYWEYDESTKTLTISGTGAIYDYDATFIGVGPDRIPKYENPPPWYDKKETYGTIERLVIKEGITRIGGYAFCKLQNLDSVSIPESVTSIKTKGLTVIKLQKKDEK
jgi:hypothetical protein